MTAAPDAGATLALLREGELEVIGRLVVSSNAALLCGLRSSGAPREDDPAATVVYKPIAFERPLWDFPDGTLAHREVAAWHVSEATGWGVVPPTVLRDGPFGVGMVQLWLERDESVEAWDLVQASDSRLRPMALFDAVVNNTDRKGGHIVPVRLDPPPGSAEHGSDHEPGSDHEVGSDREHGRRPEVGDGGQDGGPVHLFGVDHGVCFSADPKLRTVLWAWRGTPISDDELAVLRGLRTAFDGDLGVSLAGLLAPDEVAVTLERLETLLATGTFPQPSSDWPAVPWPPY